MIQLEPMVYVIDGDREVRRALQRLLESVRLRVETFETSRAFLDRCVPSQPGCLILEVRLRDLSGVELHRRLCREGYRTPVIFLTDHGDIATAVETLRAGAFHFLQKPVNEQYLLDQVQAAIRKDLRDRREDSARRAARARFERLSPRERDILSEILSGRTNREMARRLGVTVKTVEFHRANIMRKVGADSLVELVCLLLRSGWKSVKDCG